MRALRLMASFLAIVVFVGCASEEPKDAKKTAKSPAAEKSAADPSDKKSAESPQEKPQAESKLPKADFVLTDVEMFEEYEADKSATNDKYDGKIVEVKGKVGRITDRFFTFEATGDLSTEFNCNIGPEPWSKVAKGQEVTVRGKYAGSLNIVDGQIVSAGEGGATKITANELAKDFAAGNEATYEGKPLIVEGEVSDASALFKVLKTDAPPKVSFYFGPEHAAVGDKLKAGDKVKFYADEASTNADGDIVMSMVQPITK